MCVLLSVFLCPGYRNIFPFLEENHPDLCAYGTNQTNMYIYTHTPQAYNAHTLPSYASMCLT